MGTQHEWLFAARPDRTRQDLDNSQCVPLALTYLFDFRPVQTSNFSYLSILKRLFCLLCEVLHYRLPYSFPCKSMLCLNRAELRRREQVGKRPTDDGTDRDARSFLKGAKIWRICKVIRSHACKEHLCRNRVHEEETQRSNQGGLTMETLLLSCTSAALTWRTGNPPQSARSFSCFWSIFFVAFL